MMVHKKECKAPIKKMLCFRQGTRNRGGENENTWPNDKIASSKKTHIIPMTGRYWVPNRPPTSKSIMTIQVEWICNLSFFKVLLWFELSFMAYMKAKYNNWKDRSLRYQLKTIPILPSQCILSVSHRREKLLRRLVSKTVNAEWDHVSFKLIIVLRLDAQRRHYAHTLWSVISYSKIIGLKLGSVMFV